MTEDELAAIEARLRAAQPMPGGLPANQDARGYSRLATLALCDVPALVAEVRRLQCFIAYHCAGDIISGRLLSVRTHLSDDLITETRSPTHPDGYGGELTER